MNRVFARTAAALIMVSAAVLLFTAIFLPPPQLALAVPPDLDTTTAAGALHVHTERSDGRGSPDEVAEAAARAGLQFVVFTDHGDGTRTPDPPTYRAGVLCLDGVEISTRGGHYIALDLPAAPYPLGGEARDVVEDVRRLGGFGIVAHPDSPKDELRWRAWDAPFDAIEILNPDTSWRIRAASPDWSVRGSLIRALLTYPIRPVETISSVLTPTDDVVQRWLGLIRQRPVVAIAGVDAHAKLALRNVDPDDNELSLPFPGYEPLFRTLSVHVRTAGPLTGDAATDAKVIMRAIRGGHLFVSAEGIASPPAVRFSAVRDDVTARMGERLPGDGPTVVTAHTNAASVFTTTVWNGGARLLAGTGTPEPIKVTGDGGAVWMDVRATDRAGAPLWLMTNPIYTSHPDPLVRPRSLLVEPSEAQRWLVDDSAIGTWSTEHDPASTASLTIDAQGGGPELTFHYGLAMTGEAMPFSALAVFTRGGMLDGLDAVEFHARADRPMRVSVQLRARDEATVDDRWARSVYLDQTERAYRIEFDDFRPIGGTRLANAPVAAVHSIVFAIDTTHNRPGTSGRLVFRRVGLD